MQAKSVHDSLLKKNVATPHLALFIFYLINDTTVAYEVKTTVKFLC